jgi:hypothetical protein
MSEFFSVLTNILGLIASIIAFNESRKNKLGETTMNNDFKAVKGTLNIFGTISLAIFFILLIILLFPAFGKLFSLLTNKNEKPLSAEIPQYETTMQFRQLTDIDEMAFNAVKLINTWEQSDNEYLKLITIILNKEKSDLVLNIIDNINMRSNKKIALDEAYGYYISKRKYNEALVIISKYDTRIDQDEKILDYLKKIYEEIIEE